MQNSRVIGMNNQEVELEREPSKISIIDARWELKLLAERCHVLPRGSVNVFLDSLAEKFAKMEVQHQDDQFEIANLRKRLAGR